MVITEENRRSNQSGFDLSASQQRILLAELKYEGTKAYHLYAKIEFDVKEAESVRKAVPYVFSGNFNLRISNKKGSFVQYYSDEDAVFEEINADSLTDEAVEAIISRKKSEGISPIFDAPLYRLYLIHQQDRLLFFGIFHHLISDGTTVQKVIPESFSACMDRLKNGMEPLKSPESCRTYIDRVREYGAGKDAKKDRDFWINRLKGYKGIAYEPETLKKGVTDINIPESITGKLKTLQDEYRISPFVTALGASFIYFMESRRRLGLDICDMVWEISVHGRYFGEDIADDPGMYVETIPLRLEYDSQRTFTESFKYVKSVMKEGLLHARTSTNEYFSDLAASGVNLRSLTSFSAVSNSSPDKSVLFSLPDETDVPFHIRVNLNCQDTEGLQRLTFEYNTAVFEEKEISEISDGIRTLIGQAAADPGKKVSDAELEKSCFLERECALENELKTADEPVFLQSGMNRDTAVDARNSKHTGSIGSKDMKDKARLTAAFMYSLVRFGMTREVLVGLARANEVYPFGMKIDTSMSAEEFVRSVDEKLRAAEILMKYRISARSDLVFKPSVAISFDTVHELNDDILISAHISGNGLELSYNEDRYSKEYMNTFLAGIVTLYQSMTEAVPLNEIPLVQEQTGKHEILLKNEGTVGQVFDRLVRTEPDKEILVASDRRMTYKEFDNESARLGNALIGSGVKPHDRVLILMRRTSALVVSVFGVVKAGAVFITVDPDYPSERIEQIIEDSDAALVITDIPEVKETISRSVFYEELIKTGTAGNAVTGVTVTPDDMCFIIYTSGTTGRPKGVVLTHRGITNYIAPEKENEPMWFLKEKCSCMLCLSSVSFIVFLREIFGTILNGIRVVLCNEEQTMDPPAIAALIRQYHIDAMGSTPTRLLQYIQVGAFAEALGNIRFMIVGGEGFPGRLFSDIRKHSACEIYNSYGPTEVTIASHQKKMESERVSAGFPMLNVWDRISDIDGAELPPFAVGELYVGGAGVAAGYFRDEELTNKKFLTINGERYVNTGDIAYRDDKGEVFVLGRNDGMIKLRGLRIELEEIENVLGTYPGISHARVVVQTINGAEHLSAFYTLIPGQKKLPADDLRKHLGTRLPAYMVPDYYTCLEAFPLTPNGKVAVKLLKGMPVDMNDQPAFEAPVTETEKAVFEIAASVLETESFGIHEDLMQIGLTSLSIISVVSQLDEKFGISIKMSDLMKRRSVSEIALLVEERKADNSITKDTTGKKSGLKEHYPLTQNQLGIYLDCEAHPDSIGYHLPNYVRFGKETDADRLKNAVVRMIGHHPYLLTTFAMIDGEVVQKRNGGIAPADMVTVEKVADISDEKLRLLAAEPFELLGKPLFRFKIFVTDNGAVLFSVFHHLIVDGGSLNIIYRDIAAAYEGKALSEEEIDGYDLSLRENEEESSGSFEQARDFFRSRMEIADEATALTANLKGDENSGKLGVHRIGIDQSQVDDLCRRYHISQNVLFMSALAVVLTKFNSEDKLLLATVSNGRLEADVQETVALMVKTLPLVLKPDRKGTVAELFDYAANVWLETMANQSYPLTLLSREYSLHPEFFYTYHGRIYEDISIEGKSFRRQRIPYDSLRYKTMVNVILEDRYYIQVEYNDALYTPDYIKCFAKCMGDLIVSWAATEYLSGVRIRDIALAGEDTDHELKPLKEVMVHQTFERMAAESPDRDILTSCGVTLTYDQLNRRANRIANGLIKRGVKAGGHIVLLLPRTCDLIASMIGVLKAGAAYIPMDVEYPRERVNYVLEDSGADYVITSEDMPKAVSVEELLSEENESNPPITEEPGRTCYMIYTSGSTGRPKGVAVSHRNLSNLCVPVPENNYFYTRTPKPESVIQTATVSFDASILDIMPPLLNGIRVVFANDEENRNVNQLVELIRRERPTMLGDMTPSRLMQYLDSPEFAEEIRHFEACSVGGEAFLPALYDKLRVLSDLDIYNSYGPTEITIHSNTRLIKKENIMSVGKALYNVICDIRDIDGKLLPDGVMGELYIGGYGVSKGYHNMPEKTAQAFVTVNGRRYFRSGDYAYKLPDEEIVVMGRRDGQIKLRGLRIEIGEVEGSIEAYDGVKKAAVVIRKIGKTDHLCGYYTADNNVNAEALREFLSSRLTPYMVPTVLMQLDEMPYTPNGKLDRKNLPEPVIKKEYVEPATAEEAFFCQIFEQVLEIDNIGATDDFFNIGGSSLLATQLTILASNGGFVLKFRDVFDNPTPRKLAAFVTGIGTGENTAEKAELKDISEYDYSAIHEYLKQNNFENYDSGIRRKPSKVLLTGATGFLGIHILRELLEQDDVIVYCMLRGSRGRSADFRLKNRLFYYFDDDYERLDGIRLFVREGAITDESSFAAFDDDPIDTVINCAASVKHFSAGTDIYDTNVTGVKNGLDYAIKRGIRYIHISTTSTAGEILLDGEHEIFTYDEKTLYKGQILDNQYLSSKFLSERMVLEAAANGADAKIIRVGNLMARNSDGLFQINFQTNGFIGRLKAYATVNGMPYDKMLHRAEFSPIDITAKAIVALSASPKECCLFNCYNNHTVSYGDILHAANEMGVSIEAITSAEFERRMDEAMHDEKKQEGISGLITTVGMGTRKERLLTAVNNDYTIKCLYRENIFWPILSELYLETFINFLKELGFWGV